MSRVRAITSAVVALGLVTVSLAGGARAAAAPARGILSGTPHTVRLRPVIGDVFAEPTHAPTRAARVAASAAVAVCATGQPAAMRAAPSASAHHDPADQCVVARDRAQPRSAVRQLLGPAAITGSDLASVSLRPHGRHRFALSVRVVESRAQALDDFAAAHFHGHLAVTLDGAIVLTFTLSSEEPTFAGMHGGLWFAPAQGFSKATADRLRGAFSQARHEQLVGLLLAATMTTAARRIVASVTASVDDKSQFADDCPLREVPGTVVLGCFGNATLRVLRIDRPDLAPVMIVSAAHEMLHGAYEALDRAERRRIDAELERVYATLDDPQLTEIVAQYTTSEPGHRDSELHSLLGTQVATLSPKLERYYRRYFHDRQRVVAAFQSYDHVFTALEQRHDDLEAQLHSMEAQLDDQRAQVEAATARAADLGAQIEDLRGQGRIDESNDLVDPQNAAADEANALVAQGRAVVDGYNAVVDQYNEVVASANELYDSVRALPADTPAS